MDAGADCVKLQVFGAQELARRRGGDPERLRPFEIDQRTFNMLAEGLGRKSIPFGTSVFGPASANTVCGHLASMAFLKTATQEYQYAILAERVSAYAASAETPLLVSVPPDACLTVGNYWSDKPITWLACVPHYPASWEDYIGPWVGGQPRYAVLARMFDTLPGRFGISDHTPKAELHRCLKERLGDKFSGKLVVWEKHFCYDESLRDHVPDGGPWSLSKTNFAKFARMLHGDAS
jgi:sialic acid synthase SpsE